MVVMRRVALGKALEVVIVAVDDDDPDRAEVLYGEARLALPEFWDELAEAYDLAYECWNYDYDIDECKRRVAKLFEKE